LIRSSALDGVAPSLGAAPTGVLAAIETIASAAASPVANDRDREPSAGGRREYMSIVVSLSVGVAACLVGQERNAACEQALQPRQGRAVKKV
jgi:uncharacterized protein HemX